MDIIGQAEQVADDAQRRRKDRRATEPPTENPFTYERVDQKTTIRVTADQQGRVTLAMENNDGPLLQYCQDLQATDIKALIQALTVSLDTIS